MEAFNINFEDAEILKKIAGNIPSKSINDTEAVIINRQQGLAPIEILLKNASLVVEWRIKEIAAIIKTEIVRAGYDNTLTNGIILTGGTSSMTIIKDIFIDITKIKSVRRAKINDKINEKINFNGMDYLNKPKYTTLMGLLRVAYIPYDSRVDNRVLLHSHTKPSPIEIVVPEKKQPEPKKIGLLEKIKNIMRDDDSMNDDYSKN
jgi:cell division protein FtsA